MLQVQFAIMTYRLDISFSADTEFPITNNATEQQHDGPQNPALATVDNDTDP